MAEGNSITDVRHFMNSSEGQATLEEIRAMLKGKTITDVTFSDEGERIATTLRLDNGESFVLFQPSLEADVIRMEFADVLEREYGAEPVPKKRYSVGVRETHVRYYAVEAENEQQAKDLVAQRAQNVVDQGSEEYANELDKDTWSVEEAEAPQPSSGPGEESEP